MPSITKKKKIITTINRISAVLPLHGRYGIGLGGLS
jgi:hypothetical protein